MFRQLRRGRVCFSPTVSCKNRAMPRVGRTLLSTYERENLATARPDTKIELRVNEERPLVDLVTCQNREERERSSKSLIRDYYD